MMQTIMICDAILGKERSSKDVLLISRKIVKKSLKRMKKLVILVTIIVLCMSCYTSTKHNTQTTFKVSKVKTTDKYISNYQVRASYNEQPDRVPSLVFWFSDSIGRYNVGDQLEFVVKPPIKRHKLGPVWEN